MDNNIGQLQQDIRWWYPRQRLRRTNWLYRIDALRLYDQREITFLNSLGSIFFEYSTIFLSWGYTLQTILQRMSSPAKKSLRDVISMVFSMTSLLWSEGYCHYLTFLEISFYPATNRSAPSMHFLPRARSSFNDLSHSEAYQMTGYLVHNLRRLYLQLPIPHYQTIYQSFNNFYCHRHHWKTTFPLMK